MVGDIPFEVTDRDRPALVRQDAGAFALGFLGADPTTDGGEQVVAPDDGGRGFHISGRNLAYESIDLDPDGTAVDADGATAFQAAHRF
jgi:hypothetical protein